MNAMCDVVFLNRRVSKECSGNRLRENLYIWRSSINSKSFIFVVLLLEKVLMITQDSS